MNSFVALVPLGFVTPRVVLTRGEIEFGVEHGLLSAADAKLAGASASNVAGESARAWVYLLLAWVLQNPEQYPEPLRMAERIYADFDYPERLVPFIGYMPGDAPRRASRELNEARLISRWRSYLAEEKVYFAGR